MNKSKLFLTIIKNFLKLKCFLKQNKLGLDNSKLNKKNKRTL